MFRDFKVTHSLILRIRNTHKHKHHAAIRTKFDKTDDLFPLSLQDFRDRYNSSDWDNKLEEIGVALSNSPEP